MTFLCTNLNFEINKSEWILIIRFDNKPVENDRLSRVFIASNYENTLQIKYHKNSFGPTKNQSPTFRHRNCLVLVFYTDTNECSNPARSSNYWFALMTQVIIISFSLAFSLGVFFGCPVEFKTLDKSKINLSSRPTFQH